MTKMNTYEMYACYNDGECFSSYDDHDYDREDNSGFSDYEPELDEQDFVQEQKTEDNGIVEEYVWNEEGEECEEDSEDVSESESKSDDDDYVKHNRDALPPKKIETCISVPGIPVRMNPWAVLTKPKMYQIGYDEDGENEKKVVQPIKQKTEEKKDRRYSNMYEILDESTKDQQIKNQNKTKTVSQLKPFAKPFLSKKDISEGFSMVPRISKDKDKIPEPFATRACKYKTCMKTNCTYGHRASDMVLCRYRECKRKDCQYYHSHETFEAFKKRTVG